MTQLSTLKRHGADIEQAYAVLGLGSKTPKHMARRIPLEDVEKVYIAAARTLNDPFIALRVGSEFRVPNFGETGAIYGYCQNMAQVLEMNRKYQKLAVDAAKITHVKDIDGHIFTLTPYPETPLYPHVYLMIMGSYASTFQWLSWTTGKQIKAAHFNFPPPENVQLFEDVFRCTLKFNQPAMGLEFYLDSMDIPLSTADPEKLAYMVSKLETILESQNISKTFILAVRQSICAALKLGAVSLTLVAGRLGLTDRQLRQKLKTAGVTYSALLEDERKAAFERLFENGDSFAAISQSLGYNDQAAFNRAFRRWYGMSPSAYKSQSLDA